MKAERLDGKTLGFIGLAVLSGQIFNRPGMHFLLDFASLLIL
jgi:hypothetical protein